MEFKNDNEWLDFMDEIHLELYECFGRADYDVVLNEGHRLPQTFISSLSNGMNSADQKRIKHLFHTYSNPLFLKVGTFLFGYPTIDFDADKFLYSQEEIDHIRKTCEKIRFQFENPTSILINFIIGSTNRDLKVRPKKVNFSKIICLRNPDFNSEDKFRYIDERLRVYESWADFVKSNQMNLLFSRINIPKNGKYTLDGKSRVITEPDVSFDGTRLRRAGHYAGRCISTASSLVALALGICACCTPITLPLGIGAIASALFAGGYNVVDGIATIMDKNKHLESALDPVTIADIGEGALPVERGFANIKAVAKAATSDYTIKPIIQALQIASKILGTMISKSSTANEINGSQFSIDTGEELDSFRHNRRLSISNGSVENLRQFFKGLPYAKRVLIFNYTRVWIKMAENNKELSFNAYLELTCFLLINFNIFDPELVESTLNLQENYTSPYTPPTGLSRGIPECRDIENAPKMRKLNQECSAIFKTINDYKNKLLAICNLIHKNIGREE